MGGLVERKAFIIAMRERVAKAIWESPEQARRESSRMNTASRLDQVRERGRALGR